MEWLRSWLLSITCAAMIAALADALCPDGFSKKLTRMAGGLLLLLAALGPIRHLDEDSLADALAKYRAQDSGYAQTMAGQEEEMIKSIIAQETAAYISDKAAALGIRDPQVRVECRMTEEGFAAPESVEVRGSGTQEAWTALEQALEADFALREDAQTFERMDVP